MKMKKIILDLCGGTGAWSKPYKKAGYETVIVDIKRGLNVLDNYTQNLIVDKKPYAILAAPPCTMFSLARTKAKKLRDLKKGMEIVRACLDIIWKCMEKKQDTRYKTTSLKFWVLENPNGMLKYFLGKPAFEFNPYDFGDNYKKKTHLWGLFNEPKKDPIKCNKVKFDKMATKDIHPEFYGKLTRQERRAITPSGFAKAFFKANR